MSPAEAVEMKAKKGDRILRNTRRARSSRVRRGARSGVIEEVLADDPPRYRVRWDDGSESVFAPEPGGATITSHTTDA